MKEDIKPEEPSRKVRITIRKPMHWSKIKHFSKPLRKRLYKYTFHTLGVFQMPYKVCETKEKFADWMFSKMGYNYGWLFIWKGYVYSKKHRGKPRPYCIATIEFTKGAGRKYNVIFHNIKRLSKYRWFCPKK